jgi:hypothetical protein
MDDPPAPSTEDDEASVSTEHVSNDPNLDRTITVRRTAAKRTFPFDLKIGETIQLGLPRPPQAENILARKKPRLGEHHSTSTDEATTENTLHDTMVDLPPPDAAASASAAVANATDHADDIADSDPVVDMHPSARTTGEIRCWTPEEDEKLTSALTNTCKKKFGKNFMTDWVAITALVPGRTRQQCHRRWWDSLDSNIDPTTGRKGKRWTANEDKRLKNAVPAQGVKNWKEIASLVPGRTKEQCHNRWHNKLVSNIDPTTARMGKWTADEDKKLKDGVREHGVKNWKAIALLVPGRTDQQCVKRWHDTLKPTFDPAMARTGKWTADEDTKLREAVGAHGGKNWEAISTQVPGRTKIQCRSRWREASVCNIDPVTARAVKWTADEDKKLKDAFRAHGGKNWKDIALLVPGRTCKQCRNRWRDALDPSIRLTNGRAGKWTADEDKMLKNAVRTYGGKNWKAIALLVRSRTSKQCFKRWCDTLDPSIGRATARMGNLIADGGNKLKDAGRAHGGNNCKATAALVSVLLQMHSQGK